MLTMPSRIEELEKKRDEFVLAGIVFLSFLVGSFIFSGIMLLVCSKKSEYARFHMMQALVTQLIEMVIVLLYVALIMILVFATIVPTVNDPEPPPMLFVIIGLHFCVVGTMTIVNITLCIWGMICGFKGKDFKIPVVGNFVFGRFFRGKRPAEAATAATPADPIE